MRSKLVIVLVVMAASVAVAASTLMRGGEGEGDEKTADADIAGQLRESFFGVDYEAGVVLGRKAFAGGNGSPEVGAWYALSAARDRNGPEALRVAEGLLARDRDSAWAQFALAGALSWHKTRGDEALAASKRALELSPNHIDFLWLRAETLRVRDRKDEAIAFLDAQGSRLDRSPELLVVKASAMYDKTLAPGLDVKARKTLQADALEVFRRARQLDAANVGPYYTPAWFLVVSRRIPDAYSLLRPIMARAASPRIHALYWRTLQENWELDAKQKTELAAADVESFLARRPGYASTLSQVVMQTDGLGLDAKRQALEKRLLAEFGESKEAEQVVLLRATLARANASAQDRSDVKEAARHRQMLQEVIDRPMHHDPSAVERASTMLFEWAENDPAVDPDELLAIVQGMRWRVKNRPDTVFARSATALARRGAHLDVAEKLARDGIAAIPASVSGARHSLREGAAVRKYEKQLHATMRDALGYVLLQQGRVEEAEKELRAALEYDPASAAANLHLGHLFHKKGQLETAEDFYIKSYSGTGTAELHDESVAALEGLYEERSGGKAGFDAYRAKLDGRARSLRKARVSSEIGRDARRADDFSLDRLGGGKQTLASLEGKYTVIAFWGAWCGVCKAAMPELAKAFSRQQDDVAFLTINTDPNPEEVRTYMASNRYDFEVALDDGYAAKAGVTSVPQIWFLDKQGRKVFEIKGYDRTQSLEEQIDTRLALLRAN